MVVPTRVDNLYTELSGSYGSELPYAAGYQGESTTDELIAEAVEVARGADIAVVVIGLPDSFENEGADREHIDMPDAHNTLVSHIHEVQPNTVVVLINGSAIDLTWVSYVPGIVEGWPGRRRGDCRCVDRKGKPVRQARGDIPVSAGRYVQLHQFLARCEQHYFL